MLSQAELADMRAVLDETFPDLCDIQRPNRVTNPDGTYTDAWTTVGHNTPVRVSPAVADRGYDLVLGGTPKSVSEWTLTFPSETDVRAEDKVTVGSRTFLVRVVNERSWEISRRVFCSEVK